MDGAPHRITRLWTRPRPGAPPVEVDTYGRAGIRGRVAHGGVVRVQDVLRAAAPGAAPEMPPAPPVGRLKEPEAGG